MRAFRPWDIPWGTPRNYAWDTPCMCRGHDDLYDRRDELPHGKIPWIYREVLHESFRRFYPWQSLFVLGATWVTAPVAHGITHAPWHSNMRM